MHSCARVLLLLALLAGGLVLLALPPKLAPTGAQGKFVIDKAFLENVRYSPLLELASHLVGAGTLLWAFPVDTASLVRAARWRSGLYDTPLWEDSVDKNYSLSRLAVIGKSMEQEAMPYLSPLGWIMMRETLVSGLVSQLKMQQFVLQHPDVLRETVARPIVVAGPPRTMTTHAQSILAQHPDTAHVRFFEVLDPMEPDNAALSETDADPRFAMVQLAQWMMSYMRELNVYMFPISVRAAAEDLHWMGNCFGSSVYEVEMNAPSYSKLWHSSDNKPAYRFLKLTQQVVQFQERKRFERAHKPWHGPRRWIMKTPEHAGFLKDLMHVYPDAFVVLTHRDPVAIVSSFVVMTTYLAGFWNKRVDAVLFAKNNVEQVERRLNHLVEQIELVPKEQVVHIAFENFVKDNLGQMQLVCARVGLDMSPSNVKLMEQFIQSRPRQGANKLEYRIDTLGPLFTNDALRARFAKYVAKFAEYI